MLLYQERGRFEIFFKKDVENEHFTFSQKKQETVEQFLNRGCTTGFYFENQDRKSLLNCVSETLVDVWRLSVRALWQSFSLQDVEQPVGSLESLRAF